MPVHDWTRVDAGIFHDFHHEWISAINRTLNAGLLVRDHYALAEQIADGLDPPVRPLQGPTNDALKGGDTRGCVALATTPPRVYFHDRTEIDIYAAKAKVVAIRHASNHRVVAVVEIVAPGNKSNRHGLRSFVEKALELLRGGIHLLIVDLFPPGPRDPQGIHKLIWDEISDNNFTLPAGRPLTVASYIGGPIPETFAEPAAVGAPLPDAPLFLTPREYIQVPLEMTYQSAWEAVPSYWRNVLTTGAGS
jgi:hypothetical protein